MWRTYQLGLLLAILSSCGCTQAAWPGSGWWSGMQSGTCENRMWPDPYLLPDRQNVHNTMAIFAERGWQRQCLLGEHHFNENGKELSTAGQMRVRYIMTQTPPERRVIYVEQALTQDQTRGRIDLVQQYVTTMIPNGPLPNVQASTMASEGWSADYVDNVNKKFQSSMPTPRLQSASGSGSSGGSSGP